jgi:uncharacterized protein YmfQ (DUF2313 family)
LTLALASVAIAGTTSPLAGKDQGADLATTILTEAEPDEAGAILAAWKRLFDLNLCSTTSRVVPRPTWDNAWTLW